METFLAPLRSLLASAHDRCSNASNVTSSVPVELAEKANFDDSIKHMTEKKKEESAPDKRERVICDKLARLACVPAEGIFEFILSSSSMPLANSKNFK
jgi:hypothetical protein